MTIEPIVYILQKIYGIDVLKLAKTFSLCKKLDCAKLRERTMVMIANYVQRYDEDFKWEDVIEAEKQAVPKKEDRVMMTSIEKAEHKGLQTGLQTGRQEGRMERDQEVILNMLKKQLDISVIF